jgi:hypothetical protein
VIAASSSSTLDRLAQRSLALSPAAVLGGLAVLSAFVRGLLALRHRSAAYWPDEWIYAGLSRSIAQGHLTIHGDAAHFPAILQPVVAAPLWQFFSTTTAYQLVQLENAVAASLVVVPVYVLARFVGLTRGQGYLCATYALVVPTLVWIPVAISDFVAYPLAVGAIAAAVRAIDRPSPRRQALFLALTVLATLARIQYFVIAPAYVVAAIWIERRQAPRKHALAFAALAPAVVGALIGALGYYQVGRSSFSLQTLTWIPLQGYLVAALTGGVLVPGAVAAVIRPRERQHRAFALVVSVVAIGLLAEASGPGAEEGRFKERYLFVLLPLLAVSFFVYLRRGRPHKWVVLGVAAALAGAAAYLPVTRYAKGAEIYDAQSMIVVKLLQGATSATAAALVVAGMITVGAALALLTGRRLVAAAAVPIAIAVSLLITVPSMRFDIGHHQSAPERSQWIDRTAGSEAVTLVATPWAGQVPLLQALYWNRSITREVVMPPGEGTDRYSRTRLDVARDGRLLNVGGHFLFDEQATSASFAGARLVKRVNDFALYDARRPRFLHLVKGQLSNGDLSPYNRVIVWGRDGSARRVEFTLSRRKGTAPAKLLLGKQAFTVRAGTSATFVCAASRSPFSLEIRSASAVPDDLGRPVTVKLAGLHSLGSQAAASPGCVRTR